MNTGRNRERSVRLRRSALLALALASVFAASASVGADDDLGRLFLTPQERQELDRRRANNLGERDATRPTTPMPVTVNGKVVRSSGKTTTWINGVPHDDTYRGSDPARVAVRGRSVKVGETLDQSRGTVSDPLPGAEIQIRGASSR